jgi:chromosomal replication initiator protein
VTPVGEAVAAVLAVVAREYGIEADELRGPRRTRSVAEARLMAYALLRDTAGMSYPEIGAALGDRDHTTVMAGVRSTARRIAGDAYAAAAFARMRQRCVDAREQRRAG